MSWNDGNYSVDWSPGWQKQQWKKEIWTEWITSQGPWNLFMTLTFRSQGGTPPGRARSSRAINNFLKLVDPSYNVFAVEERGNKSSRLHWHLLMGLPLSGAYSLGAKWENCSLPIPLMSALIWWSQTQGFIKLSDIDAHIDYVLKYVLKTDEPEWRARFPKVEGDVVSGS